MTASFAQVINRYQGIAPKSIINAVKSAAIRTGADFSFLMEKASAESNFNPNIKAKTSSATGLFQFIDSTWLDMVKKYGEKYGLGSLAKKITTDKNGKICVDCNKTKEKILELRKDPKIASFMAAEFSASNKRYLEKNLNIKIGSTEVYLAHFMGAKGATNFLNKRLSNGKTLASEAFPKEANANKNVFFDKTSGKPRTLNEVYNFFNKKFSNNEVNFNGEILPSSYPSVLENTARDFTFTVPVHKLPYPTLENAQALLSFTQYSQSNNKEENTLGYSHTSLNTLSSYAEKIYSDAIALMVQNNTILNTQNI